MPQLSLEFQRIGPGQDRRVLPFVGWVGRQSVRPSATADEWQQGTPVQPGKADLGDRTGSSADDDARVPGEGHQQVPGVSHPARHDDSRRPIRGGHLVRRNDAEYLATRRNRPLGCHSSGWAAAATYHGDAEAGEERACLCRAGIGVRAWLGTTENADLRATDGYRWGRRHWGRYSVNSSTAPRLRRAWPANRLCARAFLHGWISLEPSWQLTNRGAGPKVDRFDTRASTVARLCGAQRPQQRPRERLQEWCDSGKCQCKSEGRASDACRVGERQLWSRKPSDRPMRAEPDHRRRYKQQQIEDSKPLHAGRGAGGNHDKGRGQQCRWNRRKSNHQP